MAADLGRIIHRQTIEVTKQVDRLEAAFSAGMAQNQKRSGRVLLASLLCSKVIALRAEFKSRSARERNLEH